MCKQRDNRKERQLSTTQRQFPSQEPSQESHPGLGQPPLWQPPLLSRRQFIGAAASMTGLALGLGLPPAGLAQAHSLAPQSGSRFTNTNIGSVLPYSPAVVYRPAINRVEAFVLSDGGVLYDNYWFGARWVWEPHGAPQGIRLVSGLAAVYQAKIDRVHVFVMGNDGNLYDNYWNGSHWVWAPHGAPPGTTLPTFRDVPSPAAVYQSKTNRIDVIVVGVNGVLYDNIWNGSEWHWEHR